MSKLVGNLLVGTLGPYVFRIVNGTQIVSKKPAPGSVKQTPATKAASKLFGDAATLGTIVRKTLSEQFPNLFRRVVTNAISGQLFRSLNKSKNPDTGHFEFDRDSFADLDQLEFNPNSPISEIMTKLPDLVLTKDQLMLTLPSLSIPREFAFPRKTAKCEIVVALSLFRLNDGMMVEQAETQTVSVQRNEHKLKAQTFKFDVPPGCLCVVTMFLNYYTASKSAWMLVKDRSFSPAFICGALVTPGKYQNSDQRVWRNMIRFK